VDAKDRKEIVDRLERIEKALHVREPG